jgi:hypothetical protein
MRRSPAWADHRRVASQNMRGSTKAATTALTDRPQQLLLATFVYSWGIRTAVAVKLPRRSEETPPDVNIAGSVGMAPLRINIEPCAPIWPTHLTPVIVYDPTGLDVKLPSWVKLPSRFTAYENLPVSSNEGAVTLLLSMTVPRSAILA